MIACLRPGSEYRNKGFYRIYAQIKSFFRSITEEPGSKFVPELFLYNRSMCKKRPALLTRKVIERLRTESKEEHGYFYRNFGWGRLKERQFKEVEYKNMATVTDFMGMERFIRLGCLTEPEIGEETKNEFVLDSGFETTDEKSVS